jgi:nucleoside-diphosphate kinase
MGIEIAPLAACGLRDNKLNYKKQPRILSTQTRAASRLTWRRPFGMHRQRFNPSKGQAIMEQTLAIVKPDGVSRGLIGAVIQRIEERGLKIVAMKMLHMSRAQAQGFYAVHRERPFFNDLTAFMSSGPAVAMVLEAENAIARWRELMGATDYRKAAEGTIRREFASDIEKNVVHGSDAPETAAFEIGYFFNRFEILA